MFLLLLSSRRDYRELVQFHLKCLINSPLNPSESSAFCYVRLLINNLSFDRYRPIKVIYFFLCEFWHIVSFKELISLFKFLSIKLFIVFLSYPFDVHSICSDVFFFISDISNLCPLFFFSFPLWVAWPEDYQFY